jgi:hypothetical protein
MEMTFDLLPKADTQLINKVEMFEQLIIEEATIENSTEDINNQLPLEPQVDVKTLHPSVPKGEHEPNSDYSKWFLIFETLISNLPNELKTQIQIISGLKYTHIWLAVTAIAVIGFLYLFFRKKIK